MNKRTLFHLFVALLVWGVFLLAPHISASAQQLSKKEVYGFLQLPASAEAAALGGRTVSYISENPAMVFSNPGLYGQEMRGKLALSYLNYIGSAHAGSVLYGQDWHERGAWAVGGRFVQYGRMAGYDAQGLPTGHFAATDLALQATYAYDLSYYFRGGISLKGVYSHIDTYSSFGVGADVGVSYYNDENDLSLAIAATNIGTQLKGFHKERELLPWDIQLGMSQGLSHAPFRVHFLVHSLNPRMWGDRSRPLLRRGLRHLLLGLEFQPGERFNLIASYNPALAEDLRVQNGGALSGFSLGAGLRTSKLDIQLAATSFHPSVLSIMLSLSMPLGKRLQEL